MIKIKDSKDRLTESMLIESVGRYIHAPVNMLGDVNAWFAGMCIGMCKVYILIEPTDNGNTILEKPNVYYEICLSSGERYQLSSENLELYQITADEWVGLIYKYNDSKKVSTKSKLIDIKDRLRE